MTAGAAPRVTAERLRAALGSQRPKAAVPAPTRRFAALEAMYPGRVIENEYGRCFVAEWTFPLDHRHGLEPLSAALTLNDRGASCIARQCGSTTPSNPVFFDTETTGLSGGTGTYAFLVGLGSIEDDRVVVRQYLMRDYDEEPALLAAVSEQLAQHDAIVSYNGKTFDVPLMETRFIASRRSPGVIPPTHLDLLFSVRRLLRGQLERCSLGDVERSVLGHHRYGDMPSWMIPSVFFQFVREGDARLIGGVLEHNRDDILSLLALTGWLAKTYQSPPEHHQDNHLLVRVARTYASMGLYDDAIRALSHAVKSLGSGDRRAEAALDLARLHRSVGCGSDAETMWQVAAEHSTLGVDALIAWAKYLEHERREFDRAREVVQRAITRIELSGRIVQGIDPVRQALEHRLGRIIRRKAKVDRAA